ncbi:unnamed protein product [Paramecium primaurelia]|uniref:Uncharacterized protein n=1 Tax=Paramecium primaurelia TaxID=5886 RepID=A0A8S1KPA6_PARPR|nr:unnamed protein product [Paramecium primaurelia]
MMTSVNLNKLVETPYMMEIIVQVLPNMILKATEIINIKQIFLKKFSKMLKEFFISKQRIQMYKSQQKRHLQESINEVNKESEAEIQVDYDEFLKVTHNDLQNLETIDHHQIVIGVWNILEENSIPQQLQISQEPVEVHKQLENIFEINLLLPNQILKKKQSNLPMMHQKNTILRFMTFINYYNLKQIEKQRNLGKSIDTDRFLHDLLEYSIRLAKTMSKNEMTSVQCKQQGFYIKTKEKKRRTMAKRIFNYDDQYGAYKKDIRSCSLVQQKGANLQFIHKSIQEFLIAADLYEVLVQSKNLDTQILNIINESLSKEENQNQNCIEFLTNLKQNYEQNYRKIENLSLVQKQKQLDAFEWTIYSITRLITTIKEHDINSINYSTEIYAETRLYLNQKIYQEVRIIEFLKFLVHLTKIDNKFIISGSNALNILVEMTWIQRIKILKIQELKILIYLRVILLNAIYLNLNL